MKKRLAILLTAILLFCAFSGLAEGGEAEFSFEGTTYHVAYAGAEIADGQLRVDVSGFGGSLPFRNGQIVIIAWTSVVIDGEEMKASGVGMDGKGVYSYYFDVEQMPEAVLLYPYEDEENGILLWETDGSADGGAAVPAAAAEWPVRAGDSVLFGRYDQDNNPGNGAEAIEWIVLDVEDGLATLMSRYALDARAFNGIGMSITWDKCSLRKWLNKDFLKNAFDDAERAALQTVAVAAERNPEQPDVDPGADTEDTVYLLSVNEAIRYFGSLNIRPAMPTETAVANGVYVSNTSGDEGTTAWWLRTPGGYSDRAVYMISENRLMDNGGDVSKENYGVRPVVKAKVSELADVAAFVAEPALAAAGPENDGDAVEGSEDRVNGLSAGDSLLFGRYDQDADPANGPEKIEWIVLDEEDGLLTLMSRYVLDARAFNGVGVSVTWDRCSLRAWLNGPFLKAAFNDAEAALLQTADVTADTNPEYPDRDPGADTRDKVYLLSVDEAIEYFGALNIKPAEPTETAVAHGVYVSNTSGHAGQTAWWLRTPGGYSDRAAYIVSDNRLIGNGSDVGETDYGVRPVVKVKRADLYGVAYLKAEAVEAPAPAATEEPTPEPTAEPTPEPTAEPAPEPTEAPTPEPAPEPPKEVTTFDVLNALGNETCWVTYQALLSGEVIQKGTIGETARGVQQMLIDFGQDIAPDGNIGPKSIAALNAVQAAFDMEQTQTLDAEGYARLLPALLISTQEEKAYDLLADSLGDEYDYLRACALAASGKYFSAKLAFEACGYGDWEARAAACLQPWPDTGVLYRSPDVWGSDTELTVKYNSSYGKAMLVKIYTKNGTLARTIFIGGSGKATTTLPGGAYTIKDGTGSEWYGEKEAFGDSGSYEVMTFNSGEQEVTLKSGHSYTITINVQESDPNADSVGSDYENWGDF